MTKIKIAGAFIFAISVILAILFTYISEQNKINENLLNTINTQKAFTQEISKNIFYIYKNKTSSHRQLDDSIKEFVNNMNYKNNNFNKISCIKIDEQNEKIVKLWNQFYLSVQEFRNQIKVTTPYSNILLEDTVNKIYNKNLNLINAFDKLIDIHNLYFENKINNYKNIQFTLFLFLILLLIYLFTQIKPVISFIQKFLNTSKNIIKNSTIKDLNYINISNNSSDVLEATNNFNLLVEKINHSIEYSTTSIENTYKSMESVEKNIEDLIKLIYSMDENNEIDKELTKKEDALIESLEELNVSSQKLQDVKINLLNLISHCKKNNS